MERFLGGSPPNPHDLSLHKQVKEIGDLLKPELLRLHKHPDEASGNVHLYTTFIDQIRMVRKEMTNCDALYTFQNILNHMTQIVQITEKNSKNQEILWHLQEIMSLLFKVQNLPS